MAVSSAARMVAAMVGRKVVETVASSAGCWADQMEATSVAMMAAQSVALTVVDLVDLRAGSTAAPSAAYWAH